MSYRITVDTGGTFTDLVLANDEELLGFFKSPTTPDDMFVGVEDGLRQAAASQSLSLEDLMRETSLFVYSTTRGTNAILEGKTAKTAFIATEGHGDMLVYREGGKPDPFNLRIPYPAPYVPRALTLEVVERVLSDGSVRVPLDESTVERAVERLRAWNIEAVGVCLLWSVVNPQHELRVGELLTHALPGVEVSLSHEVNPIIREFRRASATVIDASLKPLMRAHLTDIDARLRGLGYAGDPLSVTHVSGGMLSMNELCAAPLQSVDSGPALGPVAGLTLAMIELDDEHPDAIVTDLGGTSFEISVIHGGELTYTREKWLGPEYLGHPTGMHAVDTRSVAGAGGGSIARVDVEGVLQVGPDSAGADPGPVCYGHGGIAATVTDAAAVLGYLDREYFAHGRFDLDLEGARRAVAEQVAEPLGLSTEDGAAAILAVATEVTRSFVHDQTVRQGLDPRACLLVSGGGAAGLNIVRVARELEVPQILIPSGAGVLCAIGGQYADVVTEFSQRHFTETSRFDADGVNGVLAELSRLMDEFFAKLGGEGDERREFVCEARYTDQNWEIDVPLAADRFSGPDDVKAFENEFHRVHKRLFAVDQPDQSVECINWRARARQIRSKPRLPRFDRADTTSAPVNTRSIYEGGEWIDVDVFDGPRLGPGTTMEGPCVIEDPTTTIVLPAGTSVSVSEHHNYRLDVALDGPGRARAEAEGQVQL
jgi:N-methylhydantoinase A